MTPPAPTALRTQVRCRRCARSQPPLPPGVYTCVYCGSPLPLRRWVAHPPLGRLPTDRTAPARPRDAGYGGPPRYPAAHPRWGFAPVVWRPATSKDPDAGVKAPVLGLRAAAAAALITALFGGVAAAGEFWRFRLMLRGRTEVLDGMSVRTSDALLWLGSWLALAGGVITAVIAVPAVVRAHRAAAAFAGRSVSRDPMSLWLRLLVPVWNAYGAGQILTETETLLTGRVSVGGRPRPSRLLRWWWAMWLASSVLTIVTIARGLGGSVQAVADAVELHIAVDVVAAAVAALTGSVLIRLAGLFLPRSDGLAGWVVAAPAPTRTPVADPAAARRRSGIVPPTGGQVPPTGGQVPPTGEQVPPTGEQVRPGGVETGAQRTSVAADDSDPSALTPQAPDTGPPL